MPAKPVHIVGIGADGWSGLGSDARQALIDAEVVLGSERQLALLPDVVAAHRHPWPKPLLPELASVLRSHAGRRVAIVASGDPMHFGIGARLVGLLGAARVRVLPHPSSMSIACARLGWAVQDVEVVSIVGRPLALMHPAVQPGRRVLVLVGDGDGAAAVCRLLCERGYGDSDVTVLERLGARDERVRSGTARSLLGISHDALTIAALDCRADTGVAPLPRTPGLPDDAYCHDGQITKREIRALALAALAPVPGQLLWDVGAGSGSVGIEWMRTHPSCRAIAIEPRQDRRLGAERNAESLGVPGLRLVAGAAPGALAELPPPDAVFVGGGASVPGVLEACLNALSPGGRLVANAVTLQAESALVGWQARLGGTLTRLEVQRARPLGGFTGWQPARPITQWSYIKQDGEPV